MSTTSTESDEDERRRLQDAVVDICPVVKSNHHTVKQGGKRLDSVVESADVQGLEITSEFKTFLAGKLSKVLDEF
ncbi:uncharacterized protein LOC106150940 isoform X2 [Lingula anatina]|uniref:Uncharacterized protein LOC106150940 isoform X2 n=1 Tax=Lingula anatina TaxID=7574 RepID=A0A2R2MJ36_LINAN|nr:uncharacterized protein LOC106150940 isoform X2 [Lingula anatina]|eukprot:XP_023930204.1 uncharacterized protein LOC106150940 isoform X2 [Lingula anatina]